MKGAAQCARRVQELFRSLRSRLGKVGRPAGGDPTTQLILGIFSRDMPEAKAREALDKMRGMVVDYNELRVIVPLELAESLGDYPDVFTKCEDLSRALNRIFAGEHTVMLERLTEMSKSEVKAFLEKVDGLEAYTRARIRLLGLQQHAIPLDEAMWSYARKAEILAPDCTLEEAQQFLERQIDEDDALDFVALLKKQAWNEMAAAVRRGEVERIRSVPPNRSSKNMLRPIVAPVGEEGGGEGLEEFEPAEEDEPVVIAASAKPAARPRPAGKNASAPPAKDGEAKGNRRAREEAKPKRAAPAGSAAGARTKERPKAPAARAAKRARKVSSGHK